MRCVVHDVNNPVSLVNLSLEKDFQQLFADAVQIVSEQSKVGEIKNEEIPALIAKSIALKLDGEITENQAAVKMMDEVVAASREDYLRQMQHNTNFLESLGLIDLKEEKEEDFSDEKNEDDISKKEKDVLATAIKRKEEILAMMKRASIVVEKTEQGISCRYVLHALSGHGHDAQHSYLLDSVMKKIKNLTDAEKQYLGDSFAVPALIKLPEVQGRAIRELALLSEEIFKATGIGENMAADDFLPILIACLPNDIHKLAKLKESTEKLEKFFYSFAPMGEMTYHFGSLQAAVNYKLEALTKEGNHANAVEIPPRSRETIEPELKNKKEELKELKKLKKQADGEKEAGLEERQRQLENNIYELASELYHADSSKLLKEISELNPSESAQADKNSLFFIDNLLKIHSYYDKKDIHAFSNILSFIQNAILEGKSLTDQSLEDEIVAKVCRSNNNQEGNSLKLTIKYILVNMSIAHGAQVIEELPDVATNRTKTASPKEKLALAYQHCLKQIMKVSNLDNVQREIQIWASAALAYQQSKNESGLLSRMLRKKSAPSFRNESSDCLQRIIDGENIAEVEISDANKDTVMDQLIELQELYKVHQENDKETKELDAKASDKTVEVAQADQQHKRSFPENQGQLRPRSSSFSDSAGMFFSRSRPSSDAKPAEIVEAAARPR